MGLESREPQHFALLLPAQRQCANARQSARGDLAWLPAIKYGPDDVRSQICQPGSALDVPQLRRRCCHYRVRWHGQQLIASGKTARDKLDQIGIHRRSGSRLGIKPEARLVAPRSC